MAAVLGFNSFKGLHRLTAAITFVFSALLKCYTSTYMTHEQLKDAFRL